jgi:O-antigen/teichoic acid export membrane protein
MSSINWRILLSAGAALSIQALSPILSFASSSFVAWSHGPVAFGQFVYARSASDITTTLLCFGVPQALVFYLRRDILTFQQTAVIAAAHAIFATFLLLVFWPYLASDPLRQVGWIVLTIFGLFQVLAAMSRSAVLAKRGGVNYALGQAAYPFAILVGVAISFDQGVDNYFLLFASAAALSTAIQLLSLKDEAHGVFKAIYLQDIVGLLKFGILTFIAFGASAGSLFFLNSSVLGDSHKYSDLALFGIAYQLLLVSLMPANLVAPLIFRRYAERTFHMTRSVLFRALTVIFLGCLVGMAAMQTLCGILVPVAFGPKAVGAIDPARVLLLSLPFSFTATIALAFLLARDRSQDYCIAHVLRALVIFLSMLLLPIGDRLYQAITAIILADMTSCVVSTYCLCKLFRSPQALRKGYP